MWSFIAAAALVLPPIPQTEPPRFAPSPAQMKVLTDHAMERCKALGRTCYVEPGAGVVMEPAK